MRFPVLILALAVVPLACGGGGYGGSGPTAPPETSATVNATPSLAFTPDAIDVKAGDVVTFAFGSVGHDVFFDPEGGVPQPGAPADIPGSNAGVSVARTFATAGRYHYTCHIHPFMHGTVVVMAAPVAGGG